MSKYTTELRYICEVESGAVESKGYQSINEILELARPNIFDFEYPIFDPEYKSVLETKILKHYYTREICAETVGLWKLFLERKMQEIMPYYNKLYESAVLEFNPFYDVDLTKTGNKESESHLTKSDQGNNSLVKSVTDDINDTRTIADRTVNGGSDTNSETVRNKNDHWDYYSDTPQGSVGNLENLTYLTNARHVTDDSNGSTSSGTTTYGQTVQRTIDNGDIYHKLVTDNTETTFASGGSSTDNSTDEYLERIQGKNGGVSYSKLLQEYRETFLNIDMMVIKELKDLFFNLW